MNDIVVGIALKWVVGEVATDVAASDPAAVKAKIHAAINGAFHSAWLDTKLDKLADDVVDATFKVLQDQPDLVSLLKALASKNIGAAEAAAKTLILPVVSTEVKAILAAA